MNSGIDVIIATRNRPDDLARLLPTLSNQTVPVFRAFLIDQSDDPRETARLIERIQDPRLIHVPHREKGKSRALNLGISLASTDAIAFTDDDCTLPADWLQTALRCLEQGPMAGMVFGNVIPASHDRSRFHIPSVEFPHSNSVRGPLVRSRGLIGMGANMIVRRQTFEAVGGFDEDLGPGGPLITGEDYELTYRCLNGGLEVHQRPELQVVHWGARAHETGAAKELVNLGFKAIGAGYGKHIRNGEFRAALLAAHETWMFVPSVARAIARGRGPFHLRRLVMLWRGVGAGLVRGIRIPPPRAAFRP